MHERCSRTGWTRWWRPPTGLGLRDAGAGLRGRIEGLRPQLPGWLRRTAARGGRHHGREALSGGVGDGVGMTVGVDVDEAARVGEGIGDGVVDWAGDLVGEGGEGRVGEGDGSGTRKSTWLPGRLIAGKCETASAVNGRANANGLAVVSPALQGREIIQNHEELPGKRPTTGRIDLPEPL